MNESEFLIALSVALDYDGEIAPNQDIATIEVWDSLGILSVVGLLSDLGLKIDPEMLQSIQNIRELLALVNPVLNEK
jgi:acyl carrier protein